MWDWHHNRGISGVAFWSAVLPYDVAKTVIQTSSDTHSSRNPFRTLSLIHSRAGLSGCYAGLGPTLARAFPANAAAIVTWEFTAKLLGIRRFALILLVLDQSKARIIKNQQDSKKQW
ncbi:Mitochondrial arginine transporter BAC1 [Ananas comosus]|uniref:Mitochondrial arginine transporter BAC1 n=1 Tax=Ananas comosus TaxID=4615 RepID=A0A199W655_ANACO|nr:Mitochondrial arginine transporter BAC1 [Ananas comosus]